MNKTHILPWLLAGAMALTACGGASPASGGASSSESSSRSAVSEPDQRAMVPLLTLPDTSEHAKEDPVDSSDISSQGEADSSQIPEAPAVIVLPTNPPQTGDSSVSKPKSEPKTQEPDPSGDAGSLSTAVDDSPAEPEQLEEPESKPAATRETAAAYIGKSVSSLIAAIGQPKGSDYAPSCLGDGEDGELFYDGFTVYTYRVNGTETVQDVL